MVKQARNLLAQALADSTRAGYKSAVNSIADFCKAQNLKLTFPVSADTLCLWMAAMAPKLTFNTIRVYLHGIATTHVELGFANPIENNPLVWRMFDAVKRVQGATASKQKLPVTTELLGQLERWQVMNTVEGLCLRAAMWLGTCGLLRSGEFAVRNAKSNVLLRSDLRFMSEDDEELVRAGEWHRAAYMQIHLAQSKTDPFRKGTRVLVANARAMGAMSAYLSARGPCMLGAPLFVTDKGSALDVQTLILHTRSLLKNAGVEDVDKYAGHSFRRGGATSLHHAGLPDSTIKVMGRWKSFTFARYVDAAPDTLLAASRAMTSGGRQGRSIGRVTFSAAFAETAI